MAAERICSASSASRLNSCAAPRNVFMVRWASGVTRIRQRPVGSPPFSGGRPEFDPEGADVVGEDLAQLVGGDLADEAGPAAERRDPGHRVRRRAAAGLARLVHL
jgi:hypothetical protein